MSILSQKENRFFCFSLAGLCFIFASFLLFSTWLQAQETKSMLAEREETITSAMLEQGIAPSAIAFVIKNTEVTEAGTTLLQQLGHTEQTLFWLWPAVRHVTVFQLIFLFSGWFLFCGCVLGSTIFFLKRREQLYQNAAVIITRFAEGDYRVQLPRNQQGTLYQLFTEVNQLAKALQAKSETECHSKEFLKNSISDISHQLKTPLTALQMYTEIILSEPDQPDIVINFSQKSLQAITRMEQLIQSLLKMTRLDAGNIVFSKQPYPITELLTRATAELMIRAEQENKKIFWDGDPGLTICCDIAWTSEAFGNLVKNALDHTMDGGVIHIMWHLSPAMLRLSIADNGSGIAPEDIHHIFKRFYRSQYSCDQQGVGLGLPLAKAIIEGQGGLISVQSELNVGTTFLISFLTEM